MKNSLLAKSRIFYCAPIFILLMLLSSCSQKVNFINSSIVPSAQGSIKIGKDGNNNSTIDIKILRLADPKRLTPSKSIYLVWMETADNGTKNLGQLTSDDSFFSSALKASMHAVTPFKPTKVFITAEDNAKIENPGTQVVMTTETF